MNILQNKHNALLHKGITIKCPPQLPSYSSSVILLFHFRPAVIACHRNARRQQARSMGSLFGRTYRETVMN